MSTEFKSNSRDRRKAFETFKNISIMICKLFETHVWRINLSRSPSTGENLKWRARTRKRIVFEPTTKRHWTRRAKRLTLTTASRPESPSRSLRGVVRYYLPPRTLRCTFSIPFSDTFSIPACIEITAQNTRHFLPVTGVHSSNLWSWFRTNATLTKEVLALILIACDIKRRFLFIRTNSWECQESINCRLRYILNMGKVHRIYFNYWISSFTNVWARERERERESERGLAIFPLTI